MRRGWGLGKGGELLGNSVTIKFAPREFVHVTLGEYVRRREPGAPVSSVCGEFGACVAAAVHTMLSRRHRQLGGLVCSLLGSPL